MGNERSRQPTCLSHGHPERDDGTLVRGRSYAPGPTGKAVPDENSVLRDAASWGFDTVSLYAKLVKEGLGIAWDVYTDKPGGGSAPIAEAWDKRITNITSAHNRFSREHPSGATPQFNALARWFASTDPGKLMCLDHYILGKGADLKLTVKQVQSMPTFIDLFETDNYSPNLRAAVDDAKKGAPVSVDAKVSGQNDALGNFTIHVHGVLKRASGQPTGPSVSPYLKKASPANPGVPLMFDGTMTWSDYWDFDSKMAARLKSGTGRPVTAEMSVGAAGALVDGLPFRVTSESVPMTQFSGRFPVY